MLVVEDLEGRYVPLIRRSRWAEVLCDRVERDGCLSPSAERAWSRSHSKRVIQRSASSSV